MKIIDWPKVIAAVWPAHIRAMKRLEKTVRRVNRQYDRAFVRDTKKRGK